MTTEMTEKVYIGYDSREKEAYSVCKFSMFFNTFTKLEVIPLVHRELRNQNWLMRPWAIRPRSGIWYDIMDGLDFSTEFAYSRFLVPALCHYQGWALFMDCDMVWDADIKDLFKLRNPKYAVMCVKHNHKPGNLVKMDGQTQKQYYRKNWSSFMLFNCEHPANKKLTPEIISTKSGAWLHELQWLQDHEIGSLPAEYNWIAGCSKSNINPAVVHYTDGGPWMNGYKDASHANIWWKYRNRWLDSAEYEPISETIAVNYGVYK